eukprot:16427358-Heterocapsa_arctica.AAC.1
MGMQPKDGASAMAMSPWSLRFHCRETEDAFLLGRLPKMLLHSSRIGVLVLILSVPDIVRLASRAFATMTTPADHMSHLVQYT